MPTISLVYDASGAAQGAAEYERASERVDRAAKRMAESIRRAQEAQRAQGTGALAQAASAQVAQIERVTAAQTVATRAKRTDAQALLEQERAQARQIQQGLTALSTLGGEARAYSQLTQFRLRESRALGEQINLSQTLSGVQRELQLRSQQANQQFSVGAVNARDLRLNMLGLNQAITALSLSFGRFGPAAIGIFSGIAKSIQAARAEVVQFIAQSALVGKVGVEQGAGGGSIFGPGAAGAAGGAVSRPGFGTRALAGLGGAGFLVPAAAVAASTVAIGKLVGVSNQLEVAFDEVSAITGITGTQLDGLTDAAIRFAGSSTKSVTEVANAFKLIASAAPELIETAGGIESVTQAAILLSEASGDDLRSSVQTLTSALAQFRLDASESTRVVDALAAGAKAGAIEVPQLGEVLSRTGSVANAAGIEIEELIAIIETAGRSRQPLDIISTSLRNIILRLQVAGRLKAGDDLADVFQKIADEALSAEESVKLFGLRAITTGEFLTQNVDVIRRMQEELGETGVATEQMTVRLGNLSGESDRAGAAWGGFIAALANTGPIKAAGDFLEGLQARVARVANFLTSAVQGEGAERIAGLLSSKEIEDKLAFARENFGGAFGAKQVESFELALKIRLEFERAEDERLLREGIGFGDVRTGEQSTEFIQETATATRALKESLDPLIGAWNQYQKTLGEIEELEIARNVTLTEGAGLTEEEANRQRELAKAIYDSAVARTTDSKASDEATKAREKLNAAQSSALRKSDLSFSALLRENEVLAGQVEALGRGEEALAAYNVEIAVQQSLLEEIFRIGPLTDDRAEEIERETRARFRLNGALQDQRDALNEVEQAAKQEAEERKRSAEANARALEQPYRNAAENIQREFGNTFTEIFRGGVRSAEDFKDAILDIFARLAGELVTLNLFGGLFGGIGGGSTGAGSLSAAILGARVPTPSPGGLTVTPLREDEWATVMADATKAGTEAGSEKGTRKGFSGLLDLIRGSFGGVEGGSGLGGIIGGLGGAAGIGFLGATLLGSLPFGSLGAAGPLAGGLIGGLTGLIGGEALAAGLTSLGTSISSLSSGLGETVGALASTVSKLVPYLGIIGVLGGAAFGASQGGTASWVSLAGAIYGAFIGSAIPVIGTAIGALIGSALGGLYNQGKMIVGTVQTGQNPFIDFQAQGGRSGVDPEQAFLKTWLSTFSPGLSLGAALTANERRRPPRSYFGFDTLPGGSTPDLRGREFSAESPFGTILGFSAGKGFVDDIQPYVEALVELDEAFAKHLDADQIAAAAAAVQALDFPTLIGRKFADVNNQFAQLARERSALIIGATEGADIGDAFRDFTKRGAGNFDTLTAKINEFFVGLGEFQGNVRVLSGEEIPEFELALGRLSQVFIEAKEQAEQFGLPVQQLTDAFEAGTQKLGTDLLDQLELSALARTSPLAAILIEQQKDAERLIANARAAETKTGLEIVVLAEQEAAAQRLAIIEDFTERANSSLQALRDDLVVGDLGGLSLTQRLETARENFERERLEALASPFDPRERQDVAEAGRIFVELGREWGASGQGFQDIRQFVLDTADLLIATPLTGGELPDGGANSNLQQAQLEAAVEGNTIYRQTVAELESLQIEFRKLTAEFQEMKAELER
ncbi:MAG TPA: phage tail tape measure protein, partial [Candidatus Krumholzibacteria bacterium]